MTKLACASLLLAAVFAAVQANPLRELEGHMTYMAPRLGRFNTGHFHELYKTYVAGFEKNLDRDRDDYQNYRPSGLRCVSFLQQFVIKNYTLPDLHEFVVLDACLGYLFENEFDDLEGQQPLESNLESLRNDSGLQQFWNGTKIHELDPDNQLCISNLLYQTVIAKSKHRDIDCDDTYIQIYLDFAECQNIELEDRKKDSYLNYIYEQVKERASECTKRVVGYIEEAVRDIYIKENLGHISAAKRKFFMKFGVSKSLKMQRHQRMWPEAMITLLAAVENTTTQVNLRQIQEYVRGVYISEQRKQIFLNNMAYYADKVIQPKRDSKNKQIQDEDPNGSERYKRLKNDLCMFFRKSTDEKLFDFVTPLKRLVQLLEHRELFGITDKSLVNQLIIKAREVVPVYLGTQVCNILTFTEGVIQTPTGNGKRRYQVFFKPDLSKMVRWPDAGYY